MKISTKGQYALRLMMDIAGHDGAGFVSLKDVASREGLSMKYLEQIAGTLSKAGMLQSGRGAQGGYRLTKAPKEYTVGSILKLTEGNLAPVSCTTHGPSACSRTGCCDTLPMWEKLDKLIDDYFESITLADLLKMHNCQPASEE